MSRIGRAPITIPAGVTVKVDDSNLVQVKGPKGELSRRINQDMKINIEGNILTVVRPSDDKTHRSLHGLSRTLIHNMVVGVTDGFTKNLEIVGVGYRAAKQGKNLNLALGYSHPVIIEPPAGITLDAPTATTITVHGADKELAIFASGAYLNPTRAKALSTQANISAARKVKPAARNRH